MKGLKAPDKYRLMLYDSYSNPFIGKAEVDMIAGVMDDMVKRQEIFGEFIDMTDKPYFYVFKEDKFTIPSYKPNKALPLLVSFDFNKEPCTAVISQQPTFKSLRIFDEVEVNNGSTQEVCEVIKAKYPEFKFHIDVTGDASGHNRSSLIKGNVNHYILIADELQLEDYQLLVPDVNPSHVNSRLFCNSVLSKLDVKITTNCEKVIADCIFTRVDENGQLIKTKEEGRHYFDNVRYLMHAAFPDFLDQPDKYL